MEWYSDFLIIRYGICILHFVRYCRLSRLSRSGMVLLYRDLLMMQLTFISSSNKNFFPYRCAIVFRSASYRSSASRSHRCLCFSVISSIIIVHFSFVNISLCNAAAQLSLFYLIEDYILQITSLRIFANTNSFSYYTIATIRAAFIEIAIKTKFVF